MKVRSHLASTPRILIVVVLLLVGAACNSRPEVDPEYITVIEKERAEREDRLREEDSWLTLAGLHWLEPGENRFGGDPGNEVVLSGGELPDVAGVLRLEDGQVRLEVAAGAVVMIDDEAVTDQALRDDAQENTDTVGVGRLSFYIIKRGDRFGVRVKDPQYPPRLGFEGLDYFPIDTTYRVDGAFNAFDEPRTVKIQTVIGTTVEMLAPGSVEFELDGRRHSLLPLVGKPADTEFWFIFQDETSGKESYGFRYLYADLANGRVDLDFNRTYNPPCAFTPYATCPLPPRENRLEAKIEAGEKIYAH